MTPKHKAENIFDKMCSIISSGCEHSSFCESKECKWKGINVCVTTIEEAKKCAKVAICELADNSESHQQTNYWCCVKAEIEKL